MDTQNNLEVTQLADGIIYYQNLVGDIQGIKFIIDESDSMISDAGALSKWYDWKSSNDDYIFGQRKDIDQLKLDSSPNNIKYLITQLQDSLSFAVDDYCKRLQLMPGKMSPIGISKYYAGSGMGPHTDQGPLAYLSAVFYLNDDYDGGELEFPNQGVTIKPTANSIIVFPSTEPYVHDPKIVTSGEKYISPAFWYKIED